MINDFQEYVRVHYAKRREDERFNGEHDGGGFERVIQLINAFEVGKSGLDLSYVDNFKHLICDFEAQKDPEYDEFLRLQKKFVT